MKPSQHLPAVALAVLLQLTAAAAAEPLPVAPPSLLEGCEAYDGGNDTGPAACVRCKPGYQLSSTKVCMRLGDFGSTEPSLFRAPLRRQRRW